MPVILGANSASGGYNITNSLRFNRPSSDYLSRIPASAGSTTKGTFSLWFKLSELAATRSGAYQMFYSVSDGGSPFYISIDDGDKLHIAQYNGASYDFQYVSTQLLRDVSAWYHLVVAIDTTQGTASNRVRTYLNGSEVTSWGTQTNPSSSLTVIMFKNSSTNIGRYAHTSAQYYSGYIAEQYGIDGQQLTPSSFGETDTDTGIWKPKAYTGTYGTNGFYLDFEDSANLGNDMSGNNNDFTVNNLTSIDQTTDTPTNNFCTLNPLISAGNDSGNKQVLSEGNLYVTGNQASWCHSRGTMSYSVGKWYWEAKITGKIADMNIGVSNTGTNMFGGTVQSLSGNTTIYPEGDKNINGTITTGVFTAYSLGDIIGIAHNADANTVTFYKNGSAILSDQSVSGGNDTTWTPASAVYNTTGFFSFNFGSPIYSANSYTDGAGYGNFSYAVPSGYYALCTKNLAQFG